MSQNSDIIRLQAEEHPLEGATRFESEAAFVLHMIHRKAYEIAAMIAEGRNVLDVGCNRGYGTRILAERCASVVGVDVSASALAVARERHAHPKITYQEINGLDLPFPDHAFEVVTAFQVIEHLADPPAFLKEARRVLRPEGVAVFTTPQAAIRLDPGMRPWNAFHVREYRTEELRQELGAVFRHVEMLGTFGTDELYRLELQRNQESRRRAREEQGRREPAGAQLRDAVIRSVKAVLPERVVRRIQSWLRHRSQATGGATAASGSVDFTGKYSTADVFYRQDNLDVALDLMAFASPTERWSGLDRIRGEIRA